MRKLITGLVVCCGLCMFVGCGGAGTAYDMLTHDNVIAATVEAQKGVVAFNTTVQLEMAARQRAMVAAVGRGVRIVAESQAIAPDQAAALAAKVVESLNAHLQNYDEQDRRRVELFEITMDNLNYIIQISEQSKKFALYRSDIGEQWKAYMESSMKNLIRKSD